MTVQQIMERWDTAIQLTSQGPLTIQRKGDRYLARWSDGSGIHEEVSDDIEKLIRRLPLTEIKSDAWFTQE
jgi:hypothetical protein